MDFQGVKCSAGKTDIFYWTLYNIDGIYKIYGIYRTYIKKNKNFNKIVYHQVVG